MNTLNKAQFKASKKIVKKLSKYGIACLWGQIRSGKTRAFLNASRGWRTLVVTKKDAQAGILSEAKEIGVDVDVINYHSIDTKNPDDYQLIILDEAHLYISQAQPKPSTIWKKVKRFTHRKFIIFASGTPTAEGYGGLYSMLALSSWSPFRDYQRFTKWFEYYGIPSKIYTATREVPSYKKTKTDLIKKDMKHLVVTLTRKDTGHKHEVKDIVHTIELTKHQHSLYEELKEDKVVTIGKYEILADTGAKILSKLHQIAGGIAVKCEPKVKKNPDFVKVPKKKRKKFTKDELIAYEKSKTILIPRTYYFTDESPKVKYIKDNFDPETTIILSYYKHEQTYLAKLFPHTGSVTKLSTGVDLSHYKTMIVYSMSFSASNYEQVKGRLMNVNRKSKVRCHYLISGIDEYVLNAVKNKENFTASWYKKELKNAK
jgi:hypothetical protein